jgi:hypothetical protein
MGHHYHNKKHVFRHPEKNERHLQTSRMRKDVIYTEIDGINSLYVRNLFVEQENMGKLF